VARRQPFIPLLKTSFGAARAAVHRLAAHCTRALDLICSYKKQREREKPGARGTRSPCAKGRKHTAVTTVAPAIARLSPRNGFNGFLRALLGDEFLLSPSPRGSMARRARLGRPRLRETWHQQRMPGPHDFAVRVSFVRPARRSFAHELDSEPPCDSICAREPPRPPHLNPRSRRSRAAPRVGETGGFKEMICVRKKAEYFCFEDWTGQITLEWLGN